MVREDMDNMDSKVAKKSFGLFPNPSNGDIYIISDDIKHLKDLTIEVRNVDNTLVRYLESHRGGNFNLSDLPSGNYFITLRSDGFMETQKIVLNK